MTSVTADLHGYHLAGPGGAGGDVRKVTDEDADNNLEDGEGDALAGLQPPVLTSLTQTRDLGRDLR